MRCFLFVSSILIIDSMEEKSLQNKSKTEVKGEKRAILIYLDAMIKEKKNLLV